MWEKRILKSYGDEGAAMENHMAKNIGYNSGSQQNPKLPPDVWNFFFVLKQMNKL